MRVRVEATPRVLGRPLAKDLSVGTHPRDDGGGVGVGGGGGGGGFRVLRFSARAARDDVFFARERRDASALAASTGAMG